MPDQSLTCAQLAAANGGRLEQQIERRSPNGTGSVLVDVWFTPDGVSTRPNCDGPILRVRTRNTSSQVCWVLLPAKRRGDKFLQIDPGTDVTITNQAALASVGIDTFSDAAGTDFTYTQPV